MFDGGRVTPQRAPVSLAIREEEVRSSTWVVGLRCSWLEPRTCPTRAETAAGDGTRLLFPAVANATTVQLTGSA